MLWVTGTAAPEPPSGRLRSALNGLERHRGMLSRDGGAVLELGLGVDHAAIERGHLAANVAAHHGGGGGVGGAGGGSGDKQGDAQDMDDFNGH